MVHEKTTGNEAARVTQDGWVCVFRGLTHDSAVTYPVVGSNLQPEPRCSQGLCSFHAPLLTLLTLYSVNSLIAPNCLEQRNCLHLVLLTTIGYKMGFPGTRVMT